MSKQQPNNLLEVKNLVTSFAAGKGQVNSVSNISFKVDEGEFVALVGESGSGKSVTGLSIMRLVEHNGGFIESGQILFKSDGVNFDMVNFTEDQMRTLRGHSISMIFQDPMSTLNPVLTCREQISEMVAKHLHYKSDKLEKYVIDLLDQVGIVNPEFAMGKFPHEFSGGQLQRILIAMSISCNPKLLIADEPTTALDAAVRVKILQILREVQKKRNLSIILITHDLDSVQHFADRILVMYAGKIVERGSVKAILDSPQHPYTKGLLACRPPATHRYYFLPTLSDFMRISADGQNLETIDLPQVFEDLRVKDNLRQKRLNEIYKHEPILSVQGLSKVYNSARSTFTNNYFEAVKDVSFNLYSGEILGLVGSSGCGKSTLARCLVQLALKTEGKIEVRNMRTKEMEAAKSLHKIGTDIQYIFQNPYSSLSPRMTIGEALLEPLSMNPKYKTKKEKLERVNETLYQVGLKSYHFDRYPHEFSGGQRQRIAIARALLPEPRILICDEAVSALDVSVQAQVLNLLNELKYELDLSLIFISHDLNVVRYMCDRILVMDKGKIVDEGESDSLFANPKSEITRSLMESNRYVMD